MNLSSNTKSIPTSSFSSSSSFAADYKSSQLRCISVNSGSDSGAFNRWIRWGARSQYRVSWTRHHGDCHGPQPSQSRVSFSLFHSMPLQFSSRFSGRLGYKFSFTIANYVTTPDACTNSNLLNWTKICTSGWNLICVWWSVLHLFFSACVADSSAQFQHLFN